MNKAKPWVITRDLFLSMNEVQRLYSSLSDAKDLAIQRGKSIVHIRDYFILKVLLETGIRVFELVALKVEDVRSGTLIIQRGKGNKKRNILLSKSTYKLLKNFLKIKMKVLSEPTDERSYLFLSERRQPYTTRGIRKRVKHWFTLCGFNKSLSCHSCRHTYVSHMMASGVDLPIIRDNAGHTSLAVTSIYSHAVKEDLGDLDIYSSHFSGKRNNSKSKQ